MDYLTRAQYMLRQGTYVADVLYFVGEDNPNQAEYFRPDVSPDTNPRIGRYFDPKVPAGYQYDLVNAEEIGRAHVRTPVTNAHLVCRLPREKKNHGCTDSCRPEN